MFVTIRKHQTWLWGLIIAAVIVSFVIYFTPTGSRSDRSGGRREAFGSMDGRTIDRNQYLEAYMDVQLWFFMRYGTWPERAETRKFGFSVERETRSRLVLLARLKELGIQADEGAMAQWILERFADPKQPNAAKANYEAFVGRELPRHGAREVDFQRFVQHEIGIMHLASVAGVPGKLVTPREAAHLYRQEHESVEVEVAMFVATNFLSNVTVEPGALAQFYTNRASIYRIPERVQVNFVKFDATNYQAAAEEYLKKLTNLSAEIDREYLARGPNFYRDTNDQVMPEAAAKARIRQQVRERQSLLLARKDAAGFANDLDKIKPVKAENLGNLAAAKNLAVTLSEPFGEFDGPRRVRTKLPLGEMAFKLTPEEPFTSVVPGEDGVYLLALKQRFPSELPALESIRSRVTDEFTRDQALRLARQAGTNFLNQATNALGQGKAFAAICAEAKVPMISVPRFNGRTVELQGLDPRLQVSQLKSVVAGVAVGRVGDLATTRDGGVVVYVKTRLPVPDKEVKDELPKFLAGLRQSQQYEAFNQWFSHQIEASKISVGIGKQEED